METFHYRAGRLVCEGVPLESIAERFGTPTYVYSRAAILGNWRRLARCLERVRHLVCYSVKANSNLEILQLLRWAGGGFDVVSGGELERVLRAGALPGTVVFSGVGKTAAEIDAGIQAGILMFNVESAGELELVRTRARALGKRARVAVRINPDIRAATHPYVATGEVVHKFGVPRKEALELYGRATRWQEVEVRGVACHIGSQILEIDPFRKAFDEVLSTAHHLRAQGLAVQELDLGGGYGIRYANETPFDFDRLLEGIAERLQDTPYRLVLEPGRSVVGDAGVLLTRVLYVKRNERKNFVVADAGMNDLVRPALYGSYHEIVPVVQRGGEKTCADVVGPLCETGDFLAQNREVAEVRENDLLAVLTAGAYGFVLASNYNTRPRPAEVLVHGRQVKLVRRRERVEDLLAAELRLEGAQDRPKQAGTAAGARKRRKGRSRARP